MKKFIAPLRTAARTLGWTLYAVLALWCAGAVFYNKLGPAPVRIFAAGVVLFLLAYLPILGRLYPKHKWGFHAGTATVFLGVVLFFLFLRPQQERDWTLSCARLPVTSLRQDALTVWNIRDFNYRSTTDFDINYRRNTYDLLQLEGMDMALSHWDGIELIAHMMLIFRFKDQPALVLSAECRYEKADEYSSIAGLFRKYEAIMIFGTVPDLLMLRTNYRHEQLFLYRTNFTPDETRKVLIALAAQVNGLARQPVFYNTIDFNCSTALLSSLATVRPAMGFDLRVMLNGLADWLVFDRGGFPNVRPGEGFIDYRLRHWANIRVERITDRAEYERALYSAQ